MNITYVSPHGVKLFSEGSPATILASGVDDLRGRFSELASTVAGVPGQAYSGISVEPLRFSITMVVHKTPGMSYRQADDVVRTAFSVHKYGTLTISGVAADVTLRVRLESIPAAPERNTDLLSAREVTFSLVCDDGVGWIGPLWATGEVRIVNSGDIPIYPRFWWNGAGASVVLPSGARFDLPTVDQPRILRTSSSQVSVADEAGSPDRAVLRRLESIWPEGVPIGEARSFETIGDARTQWSVGVLDPWRVING